MPERSLGGATATVRVEALDPASVRPWKFHNRALPGMDDGALDALAQLIARDGQQQLGQRPPPGDSHLVDLTRGSR